TEIGSVHPVLHELRSLLHLFPALVVPLEFREASDVLLGDPSGRSLAIFRMLKLLGSFSKGGDPRWYVRGFIVSMTSDFSHLEAAARLTEKALGAVKLPIIPLFEQSQALRDSTVIVEAMLRSTSFKTAIDRHWGGHLEVMLGYSDSAKESGVLRSRLQVAETLFKLDELCRRKKVTPVFFHGSGGSTDRGGGPIDEQTNWWPAGALKLYKVTVQGEMVERSFASPEITRGQIERIVQASGNWREAEGRTLFESKSLTSFADRVAEAYQETVRSPDFLQVIAGATPYPFLNLLKIGSRPTKRTKEVSVSGLRAIPWILCWTQTRTLFPTWWGVGRAWAETSKAERESIIAAAKDSPVFTTYLRALKNTLAKVRLSVWHIYLDSSELSDELKARIYVDFEREFDRANEFVQEVSKKTDAMEARAWLEESIHLRSPMIHPLNLLQVLAMRDRDEALLRLTVTGISSGMMTTG
ncbi:MAG: phosphoenolpyruvate carboxylase, partial [Bdellovibrionota bacterium]